MRFRPIFLTLALAAGLAPRGAAAQTDFVDRFSIHGAINMGYGKSDNAQAFGINKDGTTQYRAVVLQFGYKIDDNDRVVTQLLHRWNGNSPLNTIEKDFFPIWAFYEHAFDNGVKVKLGRAPLPRGLFNEVRFIGTLLPFYRVGRTVYGETLEQIDGVVVSKPWDLGAWRVETYGFAGGFDLRAVLADQNGTTVLNNRLENSIGTQVWINTPLEGVRLGAYLHSYQPTPKYTEPDSLRGHPTTTSMFSAEAVFQRAFVRGEFSRFQSEGHKQYGAWYAQVGVKPLSQLTVAAEYQEAVFRVEPGPLPPLMLPLSKELTVGFTWARSANVSFKLEGHQIRGYDYDTAVPTIIPPVGPPFVAGIAPATKTNYILASVSVAY